MATSRWLAPLQWASSAIKASRFSSAVMVQSARPTGASSRISCNAATLRCAANRPARLGHLECDPGRRDGDGAPRMQMRHTAAARLDDDMLPADGINVDRCQARQGVGTKIGVGAGPEPIGAGCHDGKFAARQPSHRRVEHRQQRIHERSRGPRPRRGGSAAAFESTVGHGRAGWAAPRQAG